MPEPCQTLQLGLFAPPSPEPHDSPQSEPLRTVDARESWLEAAVERLRPEGADAEIVAQEVEK